MICAACGTENEKGFKFCVKCGSNLENPQEVNYEQVDMGGYHTEEEFSSDKSGFTVGSGTFTISDRPTADSASDIYTADELNESEEEFDFSMYDEPFIPRLDTDRLSMPSAEQTQPMQPQGQYPYGQQPAMGGVPNQPAMPGMPAMGGTPQGMPGIPGAAPANPYMGQPYGQTAQPVMYGQPQIIGYDPSGMPIYGQPQPVMYAQPQIIGYDPSGMPIYGQPQPVMYAQPQIIGYDPSGMPIYGQPQPVMYAQPQIIGYDPSGMPIYGQPAIDPNAAAQPYGGIPQQGMAGVPAMGGIQQGMPGMPAMPAMGGMPGMPGAGMYGAPQQQTAPQNEPEKPQERVDVPDDFWEFFDGGKATKHHEEESPDDFFGKHGGMGDVSAAGMDTSGMKRTQKKKVDYMGDTPVVDADDLSASNAGKYQRSYMHQTDAVNADDLTEKSQEHQQDQMGVTKEVDADKLSVNEHTKSRITMHTTGDVDADQLEAYNPEHKEAMMAQADHAVEALPKKKDPYVSEVDLIELPEHMQAKKTVREETIEIPELPDLPKAGS